MRSKQVASDFPEDVQYLVCHELRRTFEDRLCADQDIRRFHDILIDAMYKAFSVSRC